MNKFFQLLAVLPILFLAISCDNDTYTKHITNPPSVDTCTPQVASFYYSKLDKCHYVLNVVVDTDGYPLLDTAMLDITSNDCSELIDGKVPYKYEFIDNQHVFKFVFKGEVPTVQCDSIKNFVFAATFVCENETIDFKSNCLCE